MPNRSGPVVIIGLDGATLTVLDQWMARGAMPRLGEVLSGGGRGVLWSTVPPMTGPAWTSMTTGVRPARHGVFDFFHWERDGTCRRAARSGDVAAPRVWDVAGSAGRRVGVFNVPVTYPASPVNGFMMTGMLTPRPCPAMAYPVSLYDDLKARDLLLRPINHAAAPNRAFARELLSSHDRADRALAYLVRRFEPDFLMCVFGEPDVFQHHFWPYCNPEQAPGGRSGGDRCLRRLVELYYRRLDQAVGWLVDFYGPEATFLAASDHGFGPLRGECRMNRILEQAGFLTVDRRRVESGLVRARFVAGVQAVLDALGVGRAVGRAVRRPPLRRLGLHRRPSPAALATRAVVWPLTRACVLSLTDHGIHVNARGRTTHGIVEPGAEYERVMEDLVAMLRSIQDPATGRPLVTGLVRRDPALSHSSVSADLYLELAGGAVTNACTLHGPAFGPPQMGGWHRRAGLLAAWGSAVRPTRDLSASILDVTPTALYVMGLPVPPEVEGQVLTGLFKEAFVAEHPAAPPDAVRKRPSPEPPVNGVQGRPPPSTDADEAAVEERLEHLGYL